MRYLYLHGFASGPTSSKAAYFREHFGELGLALEAPDLTSGDFAHLTITGQLAVVERTLAGQAACLIGSSLGGYLAALYAARHPEVARVVLMAPAFGFARRWPLRLGEQTVESWRETGWLTVYHYARKAEARVHYALLEDGLRYEDFPAVTQPVLIFHGTRDEVVPASFSQDFRALHPHAELHLLDSGHELTDVLEPMWQETRRFLRLRA